MQRLRLLLCALVATLVQHGTAAPGHIGHEPEPAEATDVLQFKRVPHNLKPDIEESHEWKDSHEWKPNPYVRRRPKQGILFLPKSTTSPAPSYFTPKIAGGKRCADDFDCMHVLGQVCKRRRRGNTGNCECPDSTPVKLEDEAQPRCVAARRVFEECADTVECSFFNPHVECINQICTCQPPNILKSKDVCMPAQLPASAAKMVGWIVSTIIVLAILVAIVLGARKLVKQSYVDDLMGPTFHSQYWREDRPNMWESVRASLAEMRDKFRSAALGRRDIGVPGQECRVTTYVPAQRAKSHARHVHQTTVRVDVHRAQSPDEDGPDVIETLLALDESDSGPLSPTSRDVMLAQEPRRCKETSVAGLAVRRTEPAGNREATPKGAANAPRKARVSGGSEETKNRLAGARASPQLLLDSESEAERIMSIVIDQLVLERKGLAQARPSAKKTDDEMGVEATPFGGGQRKDEEVVEVPSQKKTSLDGLQISGIVRSIYSHTLVTLRNKLLLLDAHPAEADSVDEESYGDSCKPCEDKGFTEAPTELRLTREMPRPDKGDGEDKSKPSPEWRGTCNPAVRDNGPSKNYVSAAHLGKQRPQRPGGNHSETTSEHRFPPHLMEASLLLGSPLDTVLDSCRSFIGPAEAPAAVDAYPMAQDCTYTLKQRKSEGCPSESYQSFSETSRSPFLKGSRKLPAGPSLFSQSTSHCATEKKGAAIKASEKLSKAGDTLKNFVSSMYPASLAATSTKSAGCFLTAYSELPQQSGYTVDHQERSSKSTAPKKNQRVHYYDADCEREPSQNRGRSHESVVSFAPVTQTPTNNVQPGTPGSVTKKKKILRNASSTLGPWISPKNKHDHEEERPLLLNSAEVPGQLKSIGKISGGDGAVQLAGEATQEEASQPNATKQKLAPANSSKSEVSMHNSSPVVGLDMKPMASECSGASSSKTLDFTSTASNHHVTKLTTSPICLAVSEKGTTKSPSSKSRASTDEAADVLENSESRKEKEARKDMQATHSTPSLSRRTPEVEDDLPRVAHLAKLKLPFGVHGCDGKGQWSKAVDKQLGRTQTPVIFSANETDELLEKNVTGKARAVFTAPLKSTWSRTSACKQGNPDDVINLNITEAELINCINKLVGSTVMQEKNSEREYPTFYCKQTPVSGYQLLQDTHLHDEEVSDEVTGKKELARCGKRCFEASCDAMNRPLSSLRRGDLKNMLKEILEEEYSHLLHMSAQIQRDVTTDTITSLPFSTCGNGESDDTSETTDQASPSRTSAGDAAMPGEASTSAGDTVVASESRSTEQSSTATTMTCTDCAGKRAEGVMTAVSSNPGDTSTTNTPVGRRSTMSMIGAPRSNKGGGQATSVLTDARVQGRRKTSSQMKHLRTAPEDTLPDGCRLEARERTRSNKASTSTSRQGSGTTTVTTVANYSSIEHAPTAAAYSTDLQSALLLSDVSVLSSSLSKPPQSDAPVRGIADISVGPQPYPDQLFVPDDEWKQMMAFEDVKRHRVSLSPPLCRTITGTGATVFAYVDEMVPFPEMKPPIDFSPSPSNASLVMVQQDLKPLPESRLVNLSDSYVPFSNWSYQADTPEMDREKEARELLPGRYGWSTVSQLNANKGHENTKKKHSSEKNTVPVSLRPKSASFHGFSAKNNGSSPAVKVKQRTKSHTDYWLKTVSLYQELTTDQMSSSGVTCSDASGTNTMFEPDQLEALERYRYQNDTLDRLPPTTEGVNPLLETFLRMQNEAPYTPTPTPRQMSTYGTDSPVERTPREARDECVGSGALFDTSVGDYSLLHRFLASTATAPAHETRQAQWKSTDRPGLEQWNGVTDNSVPRQVELTADGRQQRGHSAETGSPVGYAVNHGPSYEDSSATSFSGAKKVKTLRKTAPYRTPFPLCSSSTAGSRYNTNAAKKNWNQRMASVAVPDGGTRVMRRASRAEAKQGRANRPSRSETVLLADTREESFQNSLSALANVDGENFWNYKSLQLHEWLNQAAQYAPFEEGRPAAPLVPPRRFRYQHDGSSPSSEYYEADPTTDTGVPTSQQELTDDPNNWQ